MNGSKPCRFTWEELWTWTYKQRKFFAGWALVFVVALQATGDIHQAMFAAYGWIINAIISFLSTIAQDTRS